MSLARPFQRRFRVSWQSRCYDGGLDEQCDARRKTPVLSTSSTYFLFVFLLVFLYSLALPLLLPLPILPILFPFYLPSFTRFPPSSTYSTHSFFSNLHSFTCLPSFSIFFHLLTIASRPFLLIFLTPSLASSLLFSLSFPFPPSFILFHLSFFLPSSRHYHLASLSFSSFSSSLPHQSRHSFSPAFSYPFFQCPSSFN